MSRIKPVLYVAILLLVVLAVALNSDNLFKTNSGAGQSGPITVTGKAQIGGAFELVNQDSETVTDQDFIGRPQLIYFGFGYCPDVCPLALQQMGAALGQVDPEGTFFQPIFISVDPERDTPETLKTYVTNNGFPKGLVGLTGSTDQVEAAKRVFKMFSQKVPDPDGSAGYTVDHASLIFLMDNQGEFYDVFTHNTSTEDIIAGLQTYKKSLE